jgi:glycosyltransferase involved in cell wall biosynthesis
MIKLSVAIIAFNEERNISRCLESLSGIADEIIVADSGSTDGTTEICKNFNARVVHHPFQGHIEQKNFALSQCTYDHVLSIDADEALSPELKKSILFLKENWLNEGYTFNRLTNYCGKWIKHCGWYPDEKLRLFKKNAGKWAGTNPHDQFCMHEGGKSEKLQGDLLHYSYYSIKEHLDQVNKFTEIGSESAYNQGKRSNLALIVLKPVVRFIRDYIFHLGFLDGYYGFVICKISSHAAFIKYVKLYELTKKKQEH